MFARLRGLAQSAFGIASSTTPEPPASDAADDQATMVTTRGGRETDSPANAALRSESQRGGSLRQSSTRDTSSKRKLADGEAASPAAAVKRRRKSQSRGSGSDRHPTLEDTFKGIVEESSHVDLDDTDTRTRMELRDDTPRVITAEDEIHKIEAQAVREAELQAAAEVKAEAEEAHPAEVVESVESPTRTPREKEAEDHEVTGNKRPSSAPTATPTRNARTSLRETKRTSVPIRAKVEASHIVPFEDEATPSEVEKMQVEDEVIVISDDSAKEDSDDESGHELAAVPDKSGPVKSKVDSSDVDVENEEKNVGAYDSAAVKASELIKPEQEELEANYEAESERDEDAGETVVILPSVSKIAQHKIFSDNEPIALIPTESQDPVPDSDFDSDSASDSSDDEAPEALTTTAAHSKAAKASAAAAEAVEKQATAAKLKRQARDAALKERARQNLKTKTSLAHPKEVSSETIASSSLPALLPAHILATERPTTPEPSPLPVGPSIEQQKRARHLKFIEEGERKVKDVRRGPVDVRVLEKTNKLLAPKVNKESRSTREQWLKGREGAKTKGQKVKANSGSRMQRKAIGGGFLRR